MYQVGDYLIYRRDVCKVVMLKENSVNHQMYYVLIPIDDPSLKVEVPVNYSNGCIRSLITKEQVQEVIRKIPEIEVIESPDKFIENNYKQLLSHGAHEDLIQIIKTAYLRNQERLLQKKKIGEKDQHYFEQAERYLYNEIGIVLGMNFDQTKQYVVNYIHEMQS